MGVMWREVRVAVRALWRAPLVATLAVVALGLGIGSTVTVFSAVNAAFLRALPYPDAERLVAIWQSSPRAQEIAVPYAVVVDWAIGVAEVEGLAGFLGPGAINVALDEGPGRAARVASATRVGHAFFRTLGVQPVLGRVFTDDDMRAGAPMVAVISHRLWQQLFAGDSAVLARALSIEGARVPVVGVMPADVRYPDDTDVWTSLDRDAPAPLSRSAHNLRVLARRRAGVPPATVQDNLARLNERLERQYPEQREGLGVRVVPLRAQLLGASADVLRLLFGSVALVLLIACANVSNLLIARATGRSVDSALRRALGADRRALALPLLAEGLVVAIAGSLAGIMMAVWGRSVLAVAVPPAVVPPDSIQVDATVLAFAVLVATASGLVCSLLPAFAATRVDLRDVLSAGSRTLAGGHRTMRAFVTVQVALACALLASAALFARSLAHLDGVDPGFQSEGVSYASFSIGGAPGSSYAEPSARVRFFRSLLERLGESPGVVSVGVTTHLPFGFSPNGQVQIEGRGSEPVGGVHFRLVGGAFFETLSIPLRSGRLFDARDTDGRSRVALVNERAARALWRDESPVGDRIRMPGMDGDANWFTIVGVVADIRHRGLAREPVPEAFFPFEQRPMRTWGMQLVARVDDSASAFGADLQEVVSAIDPRVPASAQPLDTLVEAQVRPSRFRATLLAAFGATAVVLSMVGIFGVMSYFVTRRTREVGLRMALGADRRDVRRMVLGRALIPVWIGIAAGAALSLGAGRLVEALLPGISPRDPIALGGSAAIIAATAVLAAWWPAWRASRVDPVTALRES